MKLHWLSKGPTQFAGQTQRGLSWLALAAPSEEPDEDEDAPAEDGEEADPEESGEDPEADTDEEPEPESEEEPETDPDEEPEEEEEETTSFVASSSSVDRMGDVIEQDTWELESWKSNPVILYEHSHPVVGAGVGVTRGKDLRIRVKWDDHPTNPIGQLAAHQHRAGFRKAVSVGFIPGEAISRKDLPEGHPARVSDPNIPKWAAGFVFRSPELLEVSSVSVPANRDALQLGALAKLLGDPELAHRFTRSAGERVLHIDRAEMLRLLKTDEEIRKAVLALYLSQRTTQTSERSSLDHLWSK